ncbi:hypothetical protein CfE428DRAFT_1427 [Chthoniobacter flavus Ellin428]|uniref:Uncharacterized protein n=1 Tax=Chthoniobacter flavus Ellin428 TaxID=497964 RepID=B4CXY6_9BACT|nr:hypothetical protein CfE428DRAFT_1427 [Chthoniobacter flavus Ellin428]
MAMATELRKARVTSVVSTECSNIFPIGKETRGMPMERCCN